MSNPNLRLIQRIDSFENIPLDPVAEEEIKSKIKHWQKMDRGLEEQMLLLKDEINDINKANTQIQRDVRETKQGIIFCICRYFSKVFYKCFHEVYLILLLAKILLLQQNINRQL